VTSLDRQPGAHHVSGYRKISVSTPHSLAVLVFLPRPPSTCRFCLGPGSTVSMLEFLRQRRSPLVVNPYLYF
jgi:hypothetical protein